MEKWAREADFDVNFICICVNGDSTSLPVAKDFATRYQMSAVFNGYISDQASLPKFGQLGCQGLIVVDSQGNFITKRGVAFTRQGEKAWRKTEKLFFEMGVYTGDRGADAFEKPLLRFAIGDRVECRTGGNVWMPGKIIAQRVFTMGREMPYKIQLDDGRALVAPLDSDQIIRKLYIPADVEIASVSVKEMDDEHAHCMEALQRLQAERSSESLQQVHDSLKAHFDHEEELFAATGFGNHGTALSGTKSHCDDHARILSEIQSQIGNLIAEDFVRGLIDRVVTHTRDFDSKYAGKIRASAI